MVSSTFHAHRNPPNSRPPLVHLETRVGRLTDSSLRHSILLHRCPVNEFDLERPSLITRAIIVSTVYSAISLFKIFFFFTRYRDTDRSTLTRRWSNNSSLSSLFFRLSHNSTTLYEFPRFARIKYSTFWLTREGDTKKRFVWVSL